MSERVNETRLAAAALLRGEALAGLHLVVAEGPEKGHRFPLRAEQTVGRGRLADLRLTDPAASRLHARLVRDGRGLRAEDLGSKNGLRVNGRRRVRRLAPGDELTIGATRLVLAPGIADAEPAPAPPTDPARPSPLAGRAGWRPLAVAGALAAGAALLLALP